VSEAIKFQLEQQIENEKSHLGHLEEEISKIEHDLQEIQGEELSDDL
jgi:wobble nucleotide-excising tRNase